MPDCTFTVISHSVAETRTIGASLGALLKDGDVLCLQGNLGSGKTSLTQGIGQGMRITEVINSPTFVFIREHTPAEGSLFLYHVDLYRIDDADDIISLGLMDYLYGDGVTVIEWAERARQYLPTDCLWITIEIQEDNQRLLCFRAHGERYLELLQAYQSSFGAVSAAAGR